MHQSDENPTREQPLSDLLENPSGDGAAAPNVEEFTVSELSAHLKRAVEQAFGHVRVRGEISGFKKAASGHLYMTLKDEDAVLDSVCWRGVAGRLAFQPEDGLEVVVTGKVTTYAGRSKYQIMVETMEPAGAGALMALLDERRKKLAAEGLFDEEAKQDIPYLPEVIGVVTSPTGAVIKDILHRLADRFPRRVLLWPVLVQGEDAAAQIAAAIEGFNRLKAGGKVPRPDVLIVARGGGSLEDLWAFNEEVVVRAAAASSIPLISAVGHETDTTLIDFASDMRAPTPTAAAELAVPVLADLAASVMDLQRRMMSGLARLTDERRARLEGLARGLRSPMEIVEAQQQRLDDWGDRLPLRLRELVERRTQELKGVGERLGRAARQCLVDAGNTLEIQAKLLQSLSYERVLERGFALVHDKDMMPVASAGKTSPGMALNITFRDDTVAATVDGAVKEAKPKPKPRPRPKEKPPSDDQGQLL